MQREQILAAGLGVPVVGVIPLATKDVLTATNLHRMHTLLDHPLIGPAYNDLARTCMPGRDLAEFPAPEEANDAVDEAGSVVDLTLARRGLPERDGLESDDEPRRRGLFRRAQ
ncbi:unannotated protein [freshwater metagenome]|uniref:Unannotated protein n=1 Tax=freshwater metagenome TaxID=449393 RepID=A0A6J7EVT4_9ZZZZ